MKMTKEKLEIVQKELKPIVLDITVAQLTLEQLVDFDGTVVEAADVVYDYLDGFYNPSASTYMIDEVTREQLMTLRQTLIQKLV